MNSENQVCKDLIANDHRTTKNPYPLLHKKVPGGVIAYFDAETMEPLCYIPDRHTSWTGQFYVAFTVNRLTDAGWKVSEVRRETEVLARAYNSAHLRDSVYLYTMRGAIKTSIAYQQLGWNSRATDYSVCEQEGRRIMVRFLPDPAN